MVKRYEKILNATLVGFMALVVVSVPVGYKIKEIKENKQLEIEHESEIIYNEDGTIKDDSARVHCEYMKEHFGYDIHKGH